jgi:hypothetical protein
VSTEQDAEKEDPKNRLFGSIPHPRALIFIFDLIGAFVLIYRFIFLLVLVLFFWLHLIDRRPVLPVLLAFVHFLIIETLADESHLVVHVSEWVFWTFFGLFGWYLELLEEVFHLLVLLLSGAFLL